MARLFHLIVPDDFDASFCTLWQPSPYKMHLKDRLGEQALRLRIVSDMLLQYVLRHHYGLDDHGAAVGLTELDKPFLINRRDLYFNLTHSGKLSALCVSSTPCGVDAELRKKRSAEAKLVRRYFHTEEQAVYEALDEHRRTDYFFHSGKLSALCVSSTPCGVDAELRKKRSAEVKLVRRYFHTEEQAVYEALDEHRRTDYFFHIWTLKEAYLKAKGSGIRDSLSALCFVPSDSCAGEWILKDQPQFWRLRSHDTVNEDYIMSTALTGDDPDLQISSIEPRQMIQFFSE